LTYFTPPLDARYGKSKSAKEYLFKAQIQAYEGHRAMFEGYNLNKYIESTGVIQWMLNNAWPGMIWHLYDYYLNPGGSYFGSKKACGMIGDNKNVRGLHPVYNYASSDVWVYNSLYVTENPDNKVGVKGEIWSVSGNRVWQTNVVNLGPVSADGVVGPLFKVPANPPGVTGAFFFEIAVDQYIK